MKYIKTYEISGEEKNQKTDELVSEIRSLLIIVADVYGFNLEVLKYGNISSINSEDKRLFSVRSNDHTDNMNYITLTTIQDGDPFTSPINYNGKYDPEKTTELQEFLREVLYKFSRTYLINIVKSEFTFYIRYPKVDLLIEFIKKYKKTNSFKKYLEKLKLEIAAKKYNL